MTERYRRRDFGHMQLEVTFTDPGAFAKPWGFTVDMTLAADTEMLEAVCEKSSDAWAGSLTDAANQGVSVPRRRARTLRRRLQRDLRGR